ncbi:MAG: asparagine synthase (glutamine-hydrolyzing) [Syntrophobacteraceae bacterium]
MCGIAGFVNLKGQPTSPVILGRMTEALAHRGPDGEGHFTNGFIGLGHRRLAVIDLSAAGHQPMATPDGKYVISYNGEIYNFQKLRIELEAQGYHFRSRTDTEVILYAYALWGPACIERFNGMFAFALWDNQSNELFLARDRYGIKPIYYSERNNVFAFASEVKAILAHPAFQAEIDKEALVEYFTFQNFFTDRTLFRGIRLFPAGHWAKLKPGRGLVFKHYWDYSFSEPEQPASEQEYIEELDRLFRQAVNRQLVSDVDIGAYLSGGMDSGSITAVAATQLPYIKTFTCGFDLHSASGMELSFDERQKAELMSYLFKTEHYEMVLKAGDMERIMPKFTWHLEEPRVGQSYPNYYAAQLAGKFVKVVLSGGGGDELFAGYPWRYYRAAGNYGFQDYIEKYYRYWQRLIDNRVLWKLFAPIKSEVGNVWTMDIFRHVFQEHKHTLERPEDYINHSLCFEARTFLHSLLVVEDKLSMAHSLETRVPFLDNDLVDFAMRVPVSLKLSCLEEVVRTDENELAKYYQRTRDGKMILRKVMSRYVPLEIVEAEKQGFSAPDASWFKGESIEYVKRRLLSPHACIYEYFDPTALVGLVKEHLDGKLNRRLFVWSLLNLEQFCETFLS